MNMTISAVPADDDTPRFSVLFDTKVETKHFDPRPLPRKGFWNYFKNRRAHMAWEKAYREWVDAGCPVREQTVRYYIPNASLSLDRS